MATKKTRSVKSDFVGRVRNISLSASPDHALVPVYEAINNAIQAIEDKFGTNSLAKGEITIEILRKDDENDLSRPYGFVVTDNGVGFDEDNLDSFLTADTRRKLARGGKGVGRLLWLKVFEKAKVQSVYGATERKSLSFEFVLSETDQVRNETSGKSASSTGTVVRLEPFRSEYGAQCPTKPSTIKNKIISHFLAYFVNMNAPKMQVIDGGTKEDLLDHFSKSVAKDKDYPFKVTVAGAERTFILHAFLLPKELSDDEKGNNALFYGAHSRSVERHELDRALGLQRIDGQYVYYGYVESPFLDGSVNQERTALSWQGKSFDDVHGQALSASRDFLDEYIQKVRVRQAEVVEQVRNEHLRFLAIAADPADFAKNLPLSVQTPEDIFIEMSRASLRTYTRKKASFHDAKKKKLPDFDDKAKEFARELKAESLSSLAEYVLKRKLILEVFEERLKFKNVEAEKHYFEEAVHEIICPLRLTSDGLNYEDHNLWIIDDRLAFYSFFASDKTLKSITGGADQTSKEPDIAIFDLGLGFNHRGSTEPISIIEFKRPGRNDYTLSDNPIVQVRDYVTRLRKAGIARGNDGREIREIGDDSPFMCYVIADIETTLRDIMQQFGPFHRRAGSGSYYRWDESYKIFIEIGSYAQILKEAKTRNEAFFERLGIKP